MTTDDRQRIQQLDELTASRIAAGEVVERPASVVKELVENALDARARTILVEIDQGGRRRIRVTDDGRGIAPADLELAVTRHATSKIRTADDLLRVRTLGFRGEALAAIASVSHLTLRSRATDEPAAVEIRVADGRVAARRNVGAPVGTQVTVEDLFHAQPARLKYLRSDQTELGHATQLVVRHALAHPLVRFELLRDGRRQFLSPGTGNTGDALRAAFGLEVAGELIPLPGPDPASLASEDIPPSGLLRVTGFASPPHVHRATRRDIVIVVNGRPVHDAALAFAVEQAYRTLLPTGRHPVAVLLVEVPPAQVDVNVHPAKTEVRFRDERRVFAAVQHAVRTAVLGGAPVPGLRETGPWWAVRSVPGPWPAADGQTPTPRAPDQADPAWPPACTDRERSARALPSAAPAGGTDGLPPLRVLGQVALAYIVAEGPDGLYLLDQHAAHERVLYDELTRRAPDAASQLLLAPLAVTLPAVWAARLPEVVTCLDRLGFDVEPFGPDQVLVRAVPAPLADLDLGQSLRDALDLADVGRSAVDEALEARIALHVCRRAAVKAGQALTDAEMTALVRRLETAALPRTCPHGRPTTLFLPFARLWAEFGRT